MIVDLTLPISSKLPVFPGSPPPQFLNWTNLEQDGYNTELMFQSTHSGTHIDAPFHFTDNGRTVDRIPVHRLMREAILIKIPTTSEQHILKSDIVSFEREIQRIPEDGTVIFQTGWQKNLHRENFFTQNPGLGQSAASYLAAKKINMVGIDSPNIDPGQDERFPAHRIFSDNDILIVENLTNLGKIKRTKFFFSAMPLNLIKASGSPIRAVGIY